MKTLHLFFYLIIACFTLTLEAQNTIGLIRFDSASVSEGYNIFYSHNQSTVFLTDNCGELINKWDDDLTFRPGNSVYLMDNGDIIRCKRPNNFMNDSIWAGGGGATVERRNWDNELVWTYTLNNDTARLHHDIAPMPNGHVLMIAWEWKNYEEVIQAGRNPERLIQGKLFPDYILEYAPEGDSIVWEWHTWDHMIQDFDPSKDNYGNVAAHPELVDVNLSEDPEGFPDWMHSNSIDYSEELDQIILSIPYFDEFWIIDHSTTTAEAASHAGGASGMGGDILFRYGNPANYRSRAVQRLFFQHDVRWIDDPELAQSEYYKGIMIFNNRVGDNYSSIEIIDPSVINGAYEYGEGDIEPVIDFSRTIYHPDTFPLFSNGLSSAQLLPNGHLLTIAGRRGRAFEINFENNRVVWEYVIPLKAGKPVSQGDELNENDNITFAFRRHPLTAKAFEDRDLTPMGYLELNPNLDACYNLRLPTIEISDGGQLVIFPNPFDQYIELQGLDEEHQFSIVDAVGRVVLRGSVSRLNTQIQTEQVSPGFYWLHIDNIGVVKLMKY